MKEFIAVTRHEVRDDHLALNNIAHIPTIDIIDFDYPTARGAELLAHDQGRARKLLGPLAGQSRLGAEDVAGAGEVRLLSQLHRCDCGANSTDSTQRREGAKTPRKYVDIPMHMLLASPFQLSATFALSQSHVALLELAPLHRMIEAIEDRRLSRRRHRAGSDRRGGPRARSASRSWTAAFALELTPLPWGVEHWKQHGKVVPDDFLEVLRPFDAILLGAVGWPALMPDHVTLAPLVKIRQTFDQYACVRPAKLYPGVKSVLAGKGPARHRLRRHPREQRRGIRR